MVKTSSSRKHSEPLYADKDSEENSKKDRRARGGILTA